MVGMVDYRGMNMCLSIFITIFSFRGLTEMQVFDTQLRRKPIWQAYTKHTQMKQQVSKG
jgi:hypothetical protein